MVVKHENTAAKAPRSKVHSLIVAKNGNANYGLDIDNLNSERVHTVRHAYNKVHKLIFT